MAKISGLETLVLSFVTGVESAVTAHVKTELKARIVGMFDNEPDTSPRKRKGAKAAAAPKGSVLKGKKIGAQPSPISSILNTARRYSYLMPDERTPENLAKYNAKAIKAAAKEAKRLAKSAKVVKLGTMSIAQPNHVDESAPLQ